MIAPLGSLRYFPLIRLRRPRFGELRIVRDRTVARDRRSGHLLRGRLGHRGRELGLGLWDRLAIVNKGHIKVRLEGGTGRDKVAENDIFLETDEGVFLTRDRGFSEDLGGLLEAGGRDERLGLERRLGDAEEESLGGRHLGTLALGDGATLLFDLGIDFLEFVAGDDLPNAHAGVTGLIDADHLGEGFIAVAEAELVDDFAGEELGVAGVFDLHLAKHLRNDDFDVLVADLLVLRTVDVLNFREQVGLKGVFALDAEDVVRNERSFDQGVAGIHGVTGVNAERGGLGNVVFLFNAAFAANDNGLLSATLVALDFNDTGNLRHDGGVLGLPCFKDFGNTRETGGDIRGALGFLGLTGKKMSRNNQLAGIHVDTRLGGQEVEIENLAVGRINDLDLRMAFALMFDNDEALRSALAFRFGANGLAFLNVLEFNATRLFGKDRNAVGIPNGNLLAALDGILLLDEKRSTVRNLLPFKFAALGIDEGDEAVALQDDQMLVAFMVGDFNGVQIAIFNDTGGTRANIMLGRGDVSNTTRVEGTHGELGTGLTDGLGGDNAGGQTFFNQLAGGEIDAVALRTDTGERFAGERRTDANGFDVEVFNLGGDGLADDLTFADDHFISDGVDDGVAGAATDDDFAKRNIDLFALIDCGLADAVLGAAIVLWRGR